MVACVPPKACGAVSAVEGRCLGLRQGLMEKRNFNSAVPGTGGKKKQRSSTECLMF